MDQKTPTPTKVMRDGKVAVLVSPVFSAGWSSWADYDNEIRGFLLFDAGLVAMKESDASEEAVKAFLGTCMPGVYVHTKGWDDTRIEWVPVGTVFRIDECDGFETLITREDERLFTA